MPVEAWLPAVVLAVAFGVDIMLGEPRSAWHPVAWMGRYLTWASDWVNPKGNLLTTRDQGAFLRGALVWIAGAAIIFIVISYIESGLRSLSPLLAALLLGLALKPMLAWRMLRDEVRAVEAALLESLDAGRERLSWLVSREVQGMSQGEVRESAIETLAENLNDSVVSPVLWFVIGGLPAAALYRFANTADAMWGYRGMRGGRSWEWAGKWAARADDVLSWPGAQLTAWLVVLLTLGYTGRWTGPLGQEASKTSSPNSGWPMAAFALALNIRLGKPNVYTLNSQAPSPIAADTERAIGLATKVLIALLFIAQAAILLIANL